MNHLKKICAISAITLAITGCSLTASQSPSTTTTPSENNQLNIEKFTLDNGLEVVLHQDKSDPVVAVAIQYHVGSNREKEGRTGFAHFFEHMLFQNSQHVGAGKFIKNIGAMGGSLNGGTWQDGTVYYEIVPSDGLEKVLWMESDRMGYFINTVTEKGLENEKQVVKNEKRQSVDNRPYGHEYGVILKSLYPKGHPYSWSVIGSLEDLQNATLQDVRDFYQQWYGVNNATLVLAGDFNTDQAKAWINKYFSQFAARGNVTPLPPMPVTLSHSKSLYHEDNFAKLPQLSLTYPTVDHAHPDHYALDMLSTILIDGKDSVFYKVLVEQDKVAPKIRAHTSHGELAGTFSLSVRTFSDIDLDTAKQSIDKALQQFAKEGPTDKQISRILTAKETDFYQGLTSVFSKASSLANANEFFNDPHYLVKKIDHYRQVTKADILRVFNQYVLNKKYIATSFVPKGKVELALSNAVKANVVEEKIIQGAEEKFKGNQQKLAAVPQSKSSFDRSIEPEYGPANNVKLPQINSDSLSNGIKVLSIEHSELPLVSFSIRMMGGHSLDKAGKNGTASLLSKILMEGTKNKTPQQLEAAIGELGADIKLSADVDYIELTGSTLSKNYHATMALAQEILLEPRWDSNEWNRIKQQAISSLKQREGNPGSIARRVYAKLLYPHSKQGQPVSGSQAEVNQLGLDDVKSFYSNNFVTGATSVHVAGDINQTQIKASLAPLSNKLPSGNVTLEQGKPRQERDKPELYFVDVPGAKQSFIRIGHRAMTANSTDYFLAKATNQNLGGGFASQLFQILRLQKGYTYGAYSNFSKSNIGGTFSAYSSVRSNVTLESLQTFREIFDSYAKKFDQHTLASAKSVLAKQDARAFETIDDLIGVLQNITTYGLEHHYVQSKQQQVANMTLAQAKTILNKYMNRDSMVYLVVGDAKTQLHRLTELGLGQAILLDTQGNKI